MFYIYFLILYLYSCFIIIIGSIYCQTLWTILIVSMLFCLSYLDPMLMIIFFLLFFIIEINVNFQSMSSWFDAHSLVSCKSQCLIFFVICCWPLISVWCQIFVIINNRSIFFSLFESIIPTLPKCEDIASFNPTHFKITLLT